MPDEPAHEMPDDAAAMITEYLENQHAFLSWLGFTVEEFTADRLVGRIPFDDKLTNPTDPPTVQGGVASTLVDTTGGIALRPYLVDPVNDGIATINLNVNYLRRAAGDLVATAEPIRAGGSVGVSYIEVVSDVPGEGRKPVAAGTGAYRLFNSERDAGGDEDE
jgi:uncharacterized protein (TIGR00369 family)